MKIFFFLVPFFFFFLLTGVKLHKLFMVKNGKKHSQKKIYKKRKEVILHKRNEKKSREKIP